MIEEKYPINDARQRDDSQHHELRDLCRSRGRESTDWCTYRISPGPSRSSILGEKLKKGDTVEAVVLKIDKENEKFSLGIKQLEQNPWDEIIKKYPVGSDITADVTSVADFGAFVRLEEGIEGLIYSSELSSERVENPADVVKEGESVTAVITKVDPVEQKISLSIRALTDREQRDALKKLAAQQSQKQTTTLGDLLAEKLAEKADESEE